MFIIGASSFGRELESWLEAIDRRDRDWGISGYLDKDINALNGFPSDYAIVGEEDSFDFKQDDLAIIAIAEPSIKHKVYQKLKDKVRFYTYIAPSAIIGKFNKIGRGSIICPNTVLSTNVNIGDCATINLGCNIGHDVEILSFSSLMPSVNLGGGVKIKEKVFVGTASTVIPLKTIGESAFVGAGSVVVRNVKEYSKVFGNPAKRYD